MKKSLVILFAIVLFTITKTATAQTPGIDVVRIPFIGTDSALIYISGLGAPGARLNFYVVRDIDSVRVYSMDTLIDWGYFGKNIPVSGLDPQTVYVVWANVYDSTIIKPDTVFKSFTTKNVTPTGVDDVSIQQPYDPNELVDVWSMDGRLQGLSIRRMDVWDFLIWQPGAYLVRSQKNPEKVQKIIMQ